MSSKDGFPPLAKVCSGLGKAGADGRDFSLKTSGIGQWGQCGEVV